MRHILTINAKSQKAKNRAGVGNRCSVAGAVLLLVTVHCSLFIAAAQTGGTFDLSHSVIASGGGSNSTGGTLNVSGTAGQHVAGVASNSSPARFDLHGGFWFQNVAPTAAIVSITGRATTPDGNGIRGVRLVLISPNGVIRSVITSTLGYYAFDGVEVGQTYVLEISSRKYVFANPTRIFLLQDHVSGMDFTADPL